jgi:arsenate reductase
MKQRIMFVCIGNAVRSQMAEGFARVYGWDCIIPASGGLAPATRIDPTAVRLMSDIGIDIVEQFPKYYDIVAQMGFDRIVNISGHSLPGDPPTCPITVWSVEDPVGKAEERYREARDQIQKLIIGLVDEVRRSQPSEPAPQRSPVRTLPGNLVLDRKRRLRPSS